MNDVEISAPSHVLRASAARWLEEQGVACAPEHLRIPLNLRYGDAILPAHFLPATSNQQPTTAPLFTTEHDNAGNLKLFTHSFHAADLLELADQWLIGAAGKLPLSVEEGMSNDGARAVLRVAGLWQHCIGEADTISSDSPYTLLADSPHAHHTMRLLLRADRITAETRTLYLHQLTESIGDIYHRERVIPAPDPQRDAWLRLLVVACRTLSGTFQLEGVSP